jgi:hypothetical protein
MLWVTKRLIFLCLTDTTVNLVYICVTTSVIDHCVQYSTVRYSINSEQLVDMKQRETGKSVLI